MIKDSLKTLLLASLMLIVIVAVLPPALALSVSTNKSVYYPGDQLVVSGTATPNALVAIKVVNPAGSLVALDQVKADSTGKFSDTIMRFPSQATSQYPYGIYTIIVKDTANGEQQTIKVEFTSPVATITGTVVSEKGTPISGATVSIYKGTALIAVKKTGANGEFTIQVSETGAYTIKVVASGYTPCEKTIEVTQIPATIPVKIVLQVQKLTVEIVGITANGKPMLGIAREGETLTVLAKVTYGAEEITNATVKGYLTSGLRALSGLKPIEFDLAYSPTDKAYVGVVDIPVTGVDRQCTLTIEASYAGMTATCKQSFITLVNTPLVMRSIANRTSTVEKEVSSLSTTIQDLQKTVGSLKTTVSSLSSSLQQLQTTISSLAKKQDLASLQQTVSSLKNQLSTLQSQLNNLTSKVNQLSSSVGAVSGARSVAYAAIAIGIIAIIIAIISLAYLNKKIAAAA